MRQVVWFKRDLRVQDHGPLASAAQTGPVLALYALEPAQWRSPDRAGRHWQVLRLQLQDLEQQLANLGARLAIWPGEILEALKTLHDTAPFALHAHEETGNAASYARDRAVRAWCREAGVSLREQPQTGVVRRLADRDGWARRWNRRMAAPTKSLPQSIDFAPVPTGFISTGDLPSLLPQVSLPDNRVAAVPAIGRSAARATLASFLNERAAGYAKNISSPLTAEQGCSRLSLHLALGAISMREVWQALQSRRSALRELDRERRDIGLTDLRSFGGRLHWHCHFMQKLEDEPHLEFRNMARGCDGLREDSFNEQRFAAWCEGRTGYPFVDACMRMLNATGWINFRMRAMLTSFASYNLWLHWREPGLHLARQFLDYEPGIHWPQVQMQSGTTGINTLRIYNPVKQGHDQDPGATFIARWVPELAALPAPLRHAPWQAGGIDLAAAGVRIGIDYPAPIVDHAATARAARAAIGERRRAARAESERILETHGSRRRPAR